MLIQKAKTACGGLFQKHLTKAKRSSAPPSAPNEQGDYPLISSVGEDAELFVNAGKKVRVLREEKAQAKALIQDDCPLISGPADQPQVLIQKAQVKAQRSAAPLPFGMQKGGNKGGGGAA